MLLLATGMAQDKLVADAFSQNQARLEHRQTLEPLGDEVVPRSSHSRHKWLVDYGHRTS
jgi:hypothetical protein